MARPHWRALATNNCRRRLFVGSTTKKSTLTTKSRRRQFVVGARRQIARQHFVARWHLSPMWTRL